MRRAFFTIVVAAVTFVAALATGPFLAAQSTSPARPAQTSQPAQQTQPAVPVFRSGVDLVRIDVRVTDKDGLPIRDLRPDEVRITEAGDNRPILLFQHVEQPIGTYAEVAQRTIASEVSTNQGSPRGHVYVLVFDQAHITPGNEQRARRAAERFLRTRVRPGDRVALYAIPGPGPSLDFTSDVHQAISQLISIRGSREETGRGTVGEMRVYDAYEIVRGNQEILGRYVDQASTTRLALDTTASGARPGLARAGEDPAVLQQQVLDDARGVVARADDEARRLLRSLADVIATLRAVDGRKAIILFSEGFETDHVTHELEDVAAAAAQSYAVVYAMDLNSRAISPSEEQPLGGQKYAEIQSRLQSLGSLTAETDGELFNDASAHLDQVMNQISETSQDYYLVGFAPSPAAVRDRGEYRPISVHVTRPGAHVSARTGYAMGPQATTADRRRAIDAALHAPFSQQGLRVQYTTYVFHGTTPGMQRVIVSLDADLPVATPGAKPADVVFAVRNARDGSLSASGSDTIDLPRANRSGETTGIGRYRVQFELPAGVYLMRAVVREPGGLLGSADRRFTVRRLGGPSVSASDLVIGSSETQGLPVRATVYGSDALSGVFELYGRSSGQLGDVSANVDLLKLGATTPTTSTHAELGAIETSEGGASRPARIELPLEGVAPGQYLVRSTVREGGETVAELLRDVVVAPGERPAPPPPPPLTELDPELILRGELAQSYIAMLGGRAGEPLRKAADLAARGAWSDVEAAVPASASAGPADALRGLARFARRDFAGAADAFARSVAADPRDGRAQFLLGWAHAAAGHDRAAIGAWRAAVFTDPALVPAYLALIDTYLRLNQPALALQVTRSGLEKMPDSVELRDRLLRLGGQ